MTQRRVYMDNAATTPVRPEVVEAMLPFFTDNFGNSSSVHSFGRTAQQSLIDARANIATLLGCTPQEIYFTSCGTESDNWAIRGTATRLRNKGNHIVTSAIEHPAVLNTCKQLEAEGWQVTYLPVNSLGLVSPDDLDRAICDNTVLVTIMWANNEVGTIQPIRELAQVAHNHGVWFHTDAVQAAGALDINVKESGVDMLSISGHKFNAPKGIGCLYIRKGVRIDNIIYGGHQERGHRPGTENIPYIVGMSTALKLAYDEMEAKTAHLTALRDHIMDRLTTEIPYCFINGDRVNRLPNNINVSFEYIEGESILLFMDAKGFALSSGSACTSASLDPSHVLLAMGLKHEQAHGSIRISLGRTNTLEEADLLVDSLVEVVARLRAMSPLYNK